ncbi:MULTISPECIES: LysR family transcriptional regulator [unclassified Janthinobacterium]|uniref:LysR family transcriptional regulator n=1 Tax=unclassified Janthinobacterium TaxID=2610881 RepID=UPI00160BCF61|nr:MULTISPECIES: LysR family transcriptional regulator [unclassified Janthinobacterium]MBB5608319.1 DNA-binding transcriptional LysR family regulator [Janthinobacterium sp. S3T4]MBB5613715.1 DNA-binding transcriptional LysR family regulator [Janthinobacterium sp. S3M3]
MNLSDLRIFVSAARRPSLGAAALEMHLTPSAVSKALKRLEDSLGTPLFDRSAKQLVLNTSGQLLLDRAATLLALADQTRSDIMGEKAMLDCRLGGPAILLWRQGRGLAEALRGYPQASLRMLAMFEEEALAALARGDIDAALVTGEVLDGRGEHWSPEWQTTPLGSVTLHLVAGRSHPLLAQLAQSEDGLLHASSAEVLQHDFACPSRSLFCGAQRGARSDGWRDDALPRKIRYWSDDLQLLLGFVKSGDALAYLPEFALEDPELLRIQVDDCAFECREQVALVWNRQQAGGWLQRLAQMLENSVN